MLTIKKEPDGRSCFSLDGLDDTRALGEKIAAVLRPGMTLLMRGELGAGKTTLVRELCRALGWKRTCSPSFALVNEYARARIPVAHADLYRLEHVDGRDLGFDEYLDNGWVLIIEWPERLARADFEDVWRCEMSVSAAGEKRRFRVAAVGETARNALAQLEKACS